VLVVALTAGLVIGPLACSGDSTGPSANNNTPIGTYALASINGKAPPVTMYSDTNYLKVVTSESLALTTDSLYSDVLTWQETVLGHLSTYVDTQSGRWTTGIAAGALVFSEKFTGTKTNAAWGNGKITVTDTTDGVTTTIVYTRK